MNKYKEINGISFKADANEQVCNILSSAIQSRKRLKLTFGDVKTGRSWNEEHDIIGRIGKSCGTVKVPLLIHNARSTGGGAILDNCIIKIVDIESGIILYKAANFQEQEFKIVPSDMPEYSYNVLINGQLYSRHRTERSAKVLIKKLS